LKEDEENCEDFNALYERQMIEDIYEEEKGEFVLEKMINNPTSDRKSSLTPSRF
jgi:hypothetical protein